nr:hypothetical protein [uncultured Flavobacterium sp.]
MKKRLMSLTLFFGALTAANAQVGIGTLDPNKSAQLDMVASDKGMLIPRVNLTNRFDASTIVNGNVNSLLVFNLSNNLEIKPGFYYWDVNQWKRLLNDIDLNEYFENPSEIFEDTNAKNITMVLEGSVLKLTDSEGDFVQTDLALINTDNQQLTIEGSILQLENGGAVDLSQFLENTKNISLQLNEGELILTDSDNQTVSVNLSSLKTWVQGSENITVTGNGSENSPYQVAVATASATNLGIVKQSENNPSVLINAQGELSINQEQLFDIKEISGTYEVLPTDVILLGNALTADVNIVLPSAVGKKGKKITVKKLDNQEDYYVNVTSNGGSLDGVTSLYTALPFSGWDLVSDGTNWRIVNKF